jgi:integrase
MTVAGLVAAFWQRVERDGLYKKGGRVTSERSCMQVALRPVLRLFGGKPAASFGPLDLVTVRKALCAPLPPPADGEKRRRVHVGPIVRASVNKHLHRIRSVFRWGVSMQLVPPSVWEALRSVDAIRKGHSIGTRESTRVLPADPRAVAVVLRRVQATIAALIRLQWLTGMRPGEAVQMRAGDIQRTGKVWIYRPGSHKTEHHDITREVMIGPRAQRVLAPFLSLDRAAYLFVGAKKRSKNAVPHITEAAYCRAITRACAPEGPDPRFCPGSGPRGARGMPGVVPGTNSAFYDGALAAAEIYGEMAHQDLDCDYGPNGKPKPGQDAKDFNASEARVHARAAAFLRLALICEPCWQYLAPPIPGPPAPLPLDREKLQDKAKFFEEEAEKYKAKSL